MIKSLRAATTTALAAVLCAATILDATAAGAQPPPSPDQYPPPPPQGQYAPDQYAPPGGGGPPSGQYAPPPPGAEAPGSVYDAQAQQYDYDYGRRYSDWAAQYCVARHNDAAAGAIIGGVLGAVIGGGLAGRYNRGAGVVAGGAIGATTGALIGSSNTAPGGCPPGYVIRSGAPAFGYPAPVGSVFWAPGWYNPWVFVGGAWVYHPYRYWYFSHAAYWRPGWRAGSFGYRYRRW
jgi:hypothetical protein